MKIYNLGIHWIPSELLFESYVPASLNLLSHRYENCKNMRFAFNGIFIEYELILKHTPDGAP